VTVSSEWRLFHSSVWRFDRRLKWRSFRLWAASNAVPTTSDMTAELRDGRGTTLDSPPEQQKMVRMAP
jgi:hypothetical protein